MDQKKIGKFIAERRKTVALTQMQLAEKLNVTNRAVSKWENGKSLPDSSIMLELCDILNISVTDLLSGEVITVENHDQQLKNELINLIKQKEQKDKQLLATEWVIVILSALILLIPIFIVAYVPIEQEWLRVLICLSGVIPGGAGLFFAIKIEQTAGYYSCAHCGHKHVPTFNSVLWSMHFGRTRYMRCPKCKKKSWQKKVVNND